MDIKSKMKLEKSFVEIDQENNKDSRLVTKKEIKGWPDKKRWEKYILSDVLNIKLPYDTQTLKSRDTGDVLSELYQTVIRLRHEKPHGYKTRIRSAYAASFLIMGKGVYTTRHFLEAITSPDFPHDIPEDDVKSEYWIPKTAWKVYLELVWAMTDAGIK